MICSHCCLPIWMNSFSASPLTAFVVSRRILLISTEKFFRSKSLRKSFSFKFLPSQLFGLISYHFIVPLSKTLHLIASADFRICHTSTNAFIVRPRLKFSPTHFFTSVLLNPDMATHLIKRYIPKEQR